MPNPLQWLFRLFDHLVVIGMSAMGLMVFWNVVLRYGFNSGIPFSVEISRMIFVWIVFLGTIVALAQGMHMSVNSLVVRLPRPARFICFLVSHGLMLWCCWLIWQGSWIQTLLNWNNRAPISGLSVGTMYAAGLVASACMALVLIVNLWRSLRGDLPQTWSGQDSYVDTESQPTEKAR